MIRAFQVLDVSRARGPSNLAKILELAGGGGSRMLIRNVAYTSIL
jgi:hypothetical protein